MSKIWRSIVNSPKTSIAILPAIGMILVEIGQMLQGETPNIEAIIAAAGVLWVAIFARDNDTDDNAAKRSV